MEYVAVGENYVIPGVDKKGVITEVDYKEGTAVLKELNVLGEVAQSAREHKVKFAELAPPLPRRKIGGCV